MDNKSVRPRNEQLKDLHGVYMLSTLENFAQYLAVTKLLKHEFPEDFELAKLETMLDIGNYISQEKYRNILASLFFDTLD